MIDKQLLDSYLKEIPDAENRMKLEQVFSWIEQTFPQLDVAIKWNEPMFSHKGTFIIAFSKAKQHFAFSPEEYTINAFKEDIEKAGYEHTNNIVKIKWKEDIDYSLIERIIKFNIEDKINSKTYFRTKK